MLRRLAIAWLVWLALPAWAGAEPARGDPRSRIPATPDASEYWDLVAGFDSGHAVFARFMITNEGPGERTAIAYGHFREPDGRLWPWTNGKREENWDLEQDGYVLDVGSSELYLTGPPYRLLIKKDQKKAGIRLDLRIEPAGPPGWDAAAGDEPAIDLLAAGARIHGFARLRDRPGDLALSGRAALTHTWMGRSEPDVSLRRLEFFSLRGETLLYLRELTTPDGGRRGWLRAVRGGKTLYETSDFSLRGSGRSGAENDPRYPLPGSLALHSDRIEGSVRLGAGLLHHDPMEIIPQPFRFLLSFKTRPLRVWTESPYEVSFTTGADPVSIRGTGITAVTFLNPTVTSTP